MHKRRLQRLGRVLLQPDHGKIEDWPADADLLIGLFILLDLRKARTLPDTRDVAAIYAMYASEGAAALGGQLLPRRCIFLIAQDAPGNRLALDARHDEAFADPFVRRQHMHHVRHGDTGLLGFPNQLRLVGQADGTRIHGRAHALRRTAQNQRIGRGLALHGQQPGLLARAA